MTPLRILLFPFSLLYGGVTALRNKLYDWHILHSEKFPFPVIVVGNLTAGGSGKTPHTAYIVRFLKETYHIATLSRGYGRSTKGFRIANTQDNASTIGDEPMLYLTRHPEITVCVGERRPDAIRALLEARPQTDVVVLDDAFQHRALKPGLSVLLIEYDSFFSRNFLLPAGTLRESFSEKNRADIIIISKCPALPATQEKEKILRKLKPLPHQQVFFSTLLYGEPVCEKKTIPLTATMSVLLVTGIASPNPLYAYLKEKTAAVTHMRYPDHHVFTEKDLREISTQYHNLCSPEKLILTTEKDFMRLSLPPVKAMLHGLPLAFLPVEVKITENEVLFKKKIMDYVSQ